MYKITLDGDTIYTGHDRRKAIRQFSKLKREETGLLMLWFKDPHEEEYALMERRNRQA